MPPRKRAAAPMSTSAGAPEVAPAENSRPPAGKGSGEGRTRVTVDLDQGDHRALRRELMQMAEDLGVTRVTTQQVGAALFGLFLDDAELRRHVTDSLRKS